MMKIIDLKYKLFFPIFFSFFCVCADTVYPLLGWKETVDPASSAHAVKGGTIRLNGAQHPKSYNLYTDNNTYTRMTFSLMYETLLGIDSSTLEFVPCLAKRWTVSDDGCVITFEIDPAAKWSDGMPITAEDVKWTFDKVLDPSSDAGAFLVLLNGFYSPEIITNSNEKINRTIRFRTKSKKREWRTLLNCSNFEILPRHALEKEKFTTIDFTKTPVSGPYRLSRIEEQVEAEFTRRDDWWRRDSPSVQNLYNFDRIVMRYHVDNENAFEALKKKKIDIYPVYSAHLMAKGTKGSLFDKNRILIKRVSNHKPLGFQGFVMNMRKPPFNDLRVRQAMAHLLDRETMNKTLMYSEYFLMSSYYTDLYDEKNPCTNKFWNYDPKEAARLLTEAGWKKNSETGLLEKNGKPFIFTFLSRSPGEDKFLALYDAALKSVGIKMEIVRKDFAGWMRDMDKFNFEMSWASWSSGLFKNPEPLWASSEANHDGGNNLSGLEDPEIDRLIAEEKREFSAAKRKEYYKKLDSIYASHVPYILLWNTPQTRLLHWNKFGMPKSVLGKYSDESGVLTYWWYDKDAAEELDDAIRENSWLPSAPVKVQYSE
jgi:microcin C transport system substrate-binding protein